MEGNRDLENLNEQANFLKTTHLEYFEHNIPLRKRNKRINRLKVEKNDKKIEGSI